MNISRGGENIAFVKKRYAYCACQKLRCNSKNTLRGTQVLGSSKTLRAHCGLKVVQLVWGESFCKCLSAEAKLTPKQLIKLNNDHHKSGKLDFCPRQTDLFLWQFKHTWRMTWPSFAKYQTKSKKSQMGFYLSQTIFSSKKVKGLLPRQV